MSWYVYVYRDPTRDNVPVYVGKGKGERAWAHLKPTSRLGHIQKRCRDAGIRLDPEIVRYFEIEEDAYSWEAKLIKEYGLADLGTGTLVNQNAGRWMNRKVWAVPWVEGVTRKKGHTRGRRRARRVVDESIRPM